MVRRLNDKQFKQLRKQINAEQENKNVMYIQVNSSVGAELEYYHDTGTFDLDILELPRWDSSKGLGTYSHSYPPCLVPTVVRLLKQYVTEHGGTFDSMRQYEVKTGKRFSDYFEAKTHIPYHDIVLYEAQ